MISRGLAAFLGGFTLLNLLGDLLAPGFDSNDWWINFHPLPPALASCFLLLAGIVLLALAVHPPRRSWRRWLTAGIATVLADRVATACQLYREGRAPKLIFSGGPGDGPVTEPEAMRRLAGRLGVPDDAILLDPRGLSTDATVRDTAPLFQTLGIRRVL